MTPKKIVFLTDRSANIPANLQSQPKFCGYPALVVVGTHVGHGTVGISFFWLEKSKEV